MWKGNLHFGNFHSIVVNFVLFCSFLSILFTLISVLTLSNTLFLFLDCTLSLFSFYCHFHLPPRFLFPLLRCVFLLPTLWWVLQLALLQYRLNMSSMLCQSPAPPGSETLHTYQVLLPFHSGFLEVNLREFFHCTNHRYQWSATLKFFILSFWKLSGNIIMHTVTLYTCTYSKCRILD